MYVKLFGSILDSSIWSADLPTRVLWITMLAMADENGIVYASLGGLAYRARMDENDCRRSLDVLMGPDPDDRSGVLDGRRVTAVNGGWELVNYEKYRDIRTRDQMANAARQGRHRAAQKEKSAKEKELPQTHTQAQSQIRSVTRNGSNVTSNAESHNNTAGDELACLVRLLPARCHSVVATLYRAQRRPESWAAAISAMLSGLSGKSVSREQMADALIELGATDANPSPAALRAFIRRGMQDAAVGANGKIDKHKHWVDTGEVL